MNIFAWFMVILLAVFVGVHLWTWIGIIIEKIKDAKNKQDSVASVVLFFLRLIIFLLYSFCAARLFNAPWWASFLIAFALYICSLAPWFLIILFVFIFCVAIKKLPSLESIGALTSVALFALMLYLEHKIKKSDEE